ncbi:MAG: ABC transporter permease [Candidatus Acidiferrales bacterium]
MDTLLRDLRYSLRMLAKSPVFTIVAVLTLALGIGANTAIFSVVQSVLLAPLPYSQPDRLVVLWENNPRFPRVYISYPNFQDWQRRARSFQQMAAYSEEEVDLTQPGSPTHLISKHVSSGFFGTLGVSLFLGREFSSQEDQYGATPVAIISNQLWRTRFARNPQILDQSMTVNGLNYTIVGVTQEGFRFEGNADVFIPLGQSDPLILKDRASHDGILAIARLGSHSTVSQAQAEMDTVQNRLDQAYPDADRDLGIYVEPLKQAIVGYVRGTLLMLLSAVGLVLFIACANVANLLLARSATRRREFAIRLALGANRTRVLRQLLTESVLLSLIGSGAGLLFAFAGIRLMLATVPDVLPRSQEIGVNGPALVFAIGISITVGILFGLVPALRGRNFDLQTSLKAGGRGATRSHRRAESIAVVAQMALTLVLLVGAGLLLRTVRYLASVDPGFDTKHIITFKVGISSSASKSASGTRAAYQQLIEHIREIPGVQAADFTDAVPLSGQGGTLPFWVGSQKPESLQGAPRLAMFLTGPEYLRTMGIPLLRGRFLSSEDTTKTPCVVVIDAVFSSKYFPDRDPMGETLTAGFTPVGPCRIVGVVGHVRHWSLDERNTRSDNQAYYSLYQDPDQWVPVNFPDATIVVRTPLSSATVIPAIKAAVFVAGRDQTVYAVQTMRDIVADSMSAQRLPTILFSAFAGLALVLASIGIYGVISYSVTQRVHEIGIRMALGAERQHIVRMIVGHGLGLTFAGLALGTFAALVVMRLSTTFSALLYGVSTSDPITFVTVLLLLIAVAVVASYVPARSAMRVDPLAALRDE